MDTNRQLIITQTEATPDAMTVEKLTTEIKQELTIQVNGFVRIGFLLKTARDTDILSGTSYKDVMDYAKSEFGLTKDVVSRYIHICEKYSQGGNSDKLLPEYAEFGYSKLAEMLTLPDAIAEEITPETTRQEIQEIKKEYREEQAVTPMERMTEEPLSVPPLVEEKAQEIGLDVAAQTMLGKALYLIGKEKKQLFKDLCESIGKEDERKRTREALAPNEHALYTVRIPQTGKVLVSIKDESVTITSMRSGEKETHSIDEVMDAFERLIETVGKYNDPPEELFLKLYKVAPVQQQGAETEKAKNDEKAPQNTENVQKQTEMQKNGTERQEKKADTAAAQEEADTAAEQKMPESRINTPTEADFESKNEEDGQNAVSRSKNAASEDFMNEPEAEKVPANETEIVEKEPKSAKDLINTLRDRLDEPNIPVEDLEMITNAMIRAQTLRFDDEDLRKRPAERIPYLMSTLVYHTRQWKWEVVASVAKELAAAAKQIEEAEKEIYENREN